MLFGGGQGLPDQVDDLGREEPGLMELVRQHAGLAERPGQGAEVERGKPVLWFALHRVPPCSPSSRSTPLRRTIKTLS